MSWSPLFHTTDTALKHFKAVDPTMASLFSSAITHSVSIELPLPKPPRQYFSSIVRSIVSQQISIKAADAVFGRIKTAFPSLTPKAIADASEDALRACGLSRQKVRYLKHNAKMWHTVPVQSFRRLDDEALILELTKLYGIGRWTAEMFLMFTLARPDVFSFGDLGLMQSIYTHYPVRPHHTRKIESLVNSWSPHRTLASLALWWHKDGGPVVL